MDMKPKNLLQRVLGFARAELERRARVPESSELEQQSAPAQQPSSRSSDLSSASAARAGRPPEGAVQRLEAIPAQTGEGLTLRWSVSDADVARAQRLVEGKAVLCLRLVSFTKARDDVLREVQDRPSVELSGQCEIAELPQRAVVALGLRAGERFVSIAHHVL